MLEINVKQLAIAVIGGTILLLGIIMIVTPGPAFIMIPLGLAILATEFVWAKRLLHKFKSKVPARKLKSVFKMFNL